MSQDVLTHFGTKINQKTHVGYQNQVHEAAASLLAGDNARHNFRYVFGWLSRPYRVIVTP
jgi:hypothetical protein